MKTPQPQAKKGSQYWLQTLINDAPAIFDEKIELGEIKWCSPLRSDNFTEYSDSDFLQRLELHDLNDELKKFWPNRGSQWDALGKTPENEIVLVEAKANIPEIFSTCGAKAETSVRKINSSIEATQRHLGVRNNDTWLDGFYQYANRLAHLYFLHELQKVKTHLIFLYFTNDTTHIPTSQSEWNGALEVQKRMMKISPNPLLKRIKNIFIDTHEILGSDSTFKMKQERNPNEQNY